MEKNKYNKRLMLLISFGTDVSQWSMCMIAGRPANMDPDTAPDYWLGLAQPWGLWALRSDQWMENLSLSFSPLSVLSNT